MNIIGIPYRRLTIESLLPANDCESRLRAITTSEGVWVKHRWVVMTCFLALAPGVVSARQSARALECREAFPAGTAIDDLEQRFGKGVVSSTRVYVGEGSYEDAALLFGNSPEERLEVLWADPRTKRGLRSVCAKGSRTKLRAAKGVSLGMDLGTVEKINGRPFRMSGFGFDGGGGTGSWAGGALERSSGTACELRLTLQPEPGELDDPSYDQVAGDHEFSSGHPAMKASNPKVSRLCLIYE